MPPALVPNRTLRSGTHENARGGFEPKRHEAGSGCEGAGAAPTADCTYPGAVLTVCLALGSF